MRSEREQPRGYPNVVRVYGARIEDDDWPGGDRRVVAEARRESFDGVDARKTIRDESIKTEQEAYERAQEELRNDD